MTLKMNTEGDRIGRTVSMGEMLGLPGVMPPTPTNQRSGNRKERDDEGFDLSGFHSRLVSGLDRVMETSVLETPRVLKTGMSVDDALGGGIGLGKLSVIGGAHEGVSNVLAHAVLRLSEQCAVLYVPIREREEDAIARLIRAEMGTKVPEDSEERQVEAIRATMRLKQRNLGIFAEDNMTMDLVTSWLLSDQTWNRAALENIVVVIDGLEMLDDNRPVNAVLRDLRNMLSPTSAILAGCFAAEGREDDATFAETHCNADVLVRMIYGGETPPMCELSAETIADKSARPAGHLRSGPTIQRRASAEQPDALRIFFMPASVSDSMVNHRQRS